MRNPAQAAPTDADIEKMTPEQLEAFLNGGPTKVPTDEEIDRMTPEELEAFTSGGAPLPPPPPKESKPALDHVAAGLQSMGDAQLMGHAPQAASMAAPIVERVLSPIVRDDLPPWQRILRAAGNVSPVLAVAADKLVDDNVAPWKQFLGQGEGYIRDRDEVAQELRQNEAEMPVSTGLGKIAGIASTATLPVKAAGAIPGLANQSMKAKVALGGVTGAGTGFLQNPGEVRGEFGGLQLDERTGQAKLGGAFGAGLPLAAGAVSKTFSATAGRALKALAETNAFKAAGAMLKDFRAANNRGMVNKIGRWMIDNKFIKPGSTVEDISALAKEMRDAAGAQISKVYTEVMEHLTSPASKLTQAQRDRILNSGFRPVTDAQAIMAEVEAAMKGKEGKKAVLDRVKAYLDELGADYGDILDAGTANTIKSNIDGRINYAKRANDLPEFQEAMSILRRHVADRIEAQLQAIDQEVGGKLALALRKANDTYGKASTVYHIAEDRALRETANNMFGLTDKIMATGGAGVGSLIGYYKEGSVQGALTGAALGMGAMLGNKAARHYGPVLKTHAIDMVSRGVAPSFGTAVPSAHRMRKPWFHEPEPMIEGWPRRQLMEIPPEQRPMLLEKAKSFAGYDSVMRARIETLINKHGMIPADSELLQ